MAATAAGRLYTDDEMVVVQDKVTGEAWPNPIPRKWLGTDFAPNAEVASEKAQEVVKPPIPARTTTSKEALVTYAVEHGGMTEDEAAGFTKDDLHAELEKRLKV